MSAAQQHLEQAATGNDFINIDPFDLEAIVSSKAKIFPPQKIVIYGTPGVGKTTFASTFPNPIILRTEDGAAALDIPTFPEIVRTLQGFDKALTALKGNHSFKTLIIDSLDWLEPIAWKYVCAEGQKDNIEDFGFGKGYVKVDDVWRKIQQKLEVLWSTKGMSVIGIAHAASVTVDPPDMDSYQRYSLKLHKRGAALWMEWADMILFTNYKMRLLKNADNKSAKAKAAGSGERIILTQERPAYQAKSRWPLDEEIRIGNDPTWSAFHENLQEATSGAYQYTPSTTEVGVSQ